MIRASGFAPRARRGGYTLLEILLASLIAAMVLAAVYMLLNVTLQQTQATRDANEVEDVSRGIFNKFTVDLSGTLAPLPPKSGGNPAASGGAMAPADPAMTPTDPATGTPAPTAPTGAVPTDPAATATTEETDPGATENATAVAADYAFQAGVIGEEKRLTIYAGRVPEVFGRYGEPREQIRSDQRQIIYWLGSGGGLYRRERPWSTADGVRTEIQSDEGALDSALLAEEVVDLMFEYFDGSGWVPSWDGTTPGPDGVTPLGPPRAVKMTLVMQFTVGRGTQPFTKTVSQVIPVRSAPGTYTPPLVQAPTYSGDGGTETTPTTEPTPSTTPSTPSAPSSPSAPSAPSTGTPGGTKGGGSTPSPGGTRPSGGSAPKGGGR